MSDKTFDPVTEGTPEEMLNSEAWLSTTTLEAEIPLIAAQAAAEAALLKLIGGGE